MFMGQLCLRLEMALRGSRRLCIRTTEQRRPITLDLLIKISVELRKGVFDPYIDSLMQTAVTTVFWGFFRSGELSALPNVIVCELKIENDKTCLHLRTSKTDVERK